MRPSRKISPWILPPIGFILGILYAFIIIYGLVATWHLLGNPGEKIARIIGMKEGSRIVVSTETGKIYSSEVYFRGGASLLLRSAWIQEDADSIEVDPIEKWGAKFITLPPLFRIKQMYEMEYPLVEGVGEVKFAVAQDGNLWMWSYEIGSLSGLLFVFYPIIGLLIGSVVAVNIVILRFLKKK